MKVAEAEWKIISSFVVPAGDPDRALLAVQNLLKKAADEGPAYPYIPCLMCLVWCDDPPDDPLALMLIILERSL